MLLAQAGSIDYAHTFVRLFVDLAVAGILIGALFVPRHARRDLAVVYATFNIALFAVISVISVRHVSVGLGFGLFAVLSIVRLRSEPFDNVELAYFFMSLVLGLINGLERIPLAYTAMLNVLILMTMLLVDHPSLHTTTIRRRVTLDEIYTDPTELRAILEERLGVEIADIQIDKNDYVRETTDVTVRHAQPR